MVFCSSSLVSEKAGIGVNKVQYHDYACVCLVGGRHSQLFCYIYVQRCVCQFLFDFCYKVQACALQVAGVHHFVTFMYNDVYASCLIFVTRCKPVQVAGVHHFVTFMYNDVYVSCLIFVTRCKTSL